ncbi:MAG: sensor histidine kinase [Actinomycetota bacterium]
MRIPSADKVKDNRKRFAVVLVPALFIVGLAYFTVRSQGLARTSVKQRFEARLETGTSFISEFVTDRQRQEKVVALARLSDPLTDKTSFDIAVESLGFGAAVLLDDQGRLLQVYPSKPEIIGSKIAPKYKHLSAAVAGTPAVSIVVPSAAKGVPVVAIAMPYETPTGRRVFSGAFSVEVGPLGSFLKNMLPYAGSQSFLIDAEGNIAATSEAPRTQIESLGKQTPNLLRSITRSGAITSAEGTMDSEVGPIRYVSRSIPGAPWYLVAQVPEKVLYAPLARTIWPLWLVFAGLVLVGAFALLLLDRLQRSRERLVSQLAEQGRLNLALEDFSWRVAHDLKGPLAGILAGIELMNRNDLPENTRHEISARIGTQAWKAADLVSDLLDLARASGTAKRQSVSTKDLFEEVAQDAQDVAIKVSDVPDYISVDRVSFRQAALNLARNAGKYGSTDGSKTTLDVSADSDGSEVTFTFADRGPGLADDQGKTIFEPFKRGVDTKEPGSGLGLAIVGAMAEAHGGRAWYEDRPGGGASFKVLIKLQD